MNVLFDIDDTLFPSSEFSSLARKNAINAMIGMGLDSDSGTLGERLSLIISKKGSNYGRHFDDLLDEMKVPNKSRYIAAAVAAYHDTKTSIQPFPKVPMTLLRLKEAGHRLYIATRGNSVKQWDKLIRLRIALFFDRVFVCEEGEKDESFYLSVLRGLGAEAKSCMMVGDREDTDIAPAASAGIRTVRMLSGKYASVPTKADFRVAGIEELPAILQDL
ncbi:MAG TPA: HAD hydrolase-like protein [Candidatus Bilamarchaeum sp.]|nr:HAD hydrolase-like protein [Candidatus Bilamarchaeum sp.]